MHSTTVLAAEPLLPFVQCILQPGAFGLWKSCSLQFKFKNVQSCSGSFICFVVNALQFMLLVCYTSLCKDAIVWCFSTRCMWGAQLGHSLAMMVQYILLCACLMAVQSDALIQDSWCPITFIWMSVYICSRNLCVLLKRPCKFILVILNPCEILCFYIYVLLHKYACGGCHSWTCMCSDVLLGTWIDRY